MKRRTNWMGVAVVAALVAMTSGFTPIRAVAAGAGAKAAQAQAPQDKDQTLHAMRDEMARSKARLELNIPGTNEPVKPYYIEYRLLDLDFKEITAEFGTLLSSTQDRKSVV